MNRFLAIATGVALLAVATALIYFVWWNTHFACVQYKPF